MSRSEAHSRDNQSAADLIAAEDVPRPPAFADDALALQFSNLYAADLRYTAQLGRWRLWDATRWRLDETLRVMDRARKVCRDASAQCESKLAPRIASAVTIAAVERLARTDTRHAATVDEWDSDPWLLNTPGGAVDLHTGAIHPARREEYCTKITAVAPNDRECLLWRKFLERITNGDAELQQFMQRMCGYALTGSTCEHALFFLYGTGANGKTVFLNTVSGVMGDYARAAPIEAFIASRNEHHPTDLAGLQGARLVTAAETEDGRRWAESKLKALTGGDRIAARFMRQNFFEFEPQFKLIAAGNHRPALGTVDEAMRRRFNLLPFNETIPARERDAELGERLRQEWGSILQWMIKGCLAWQERGLNSPAIVNQATEDYLASEDALGRWLEECCVQERNLSASSTALYKSWREWCKKNGEPEDSQKRFSQNLEARGFARERSAVMRAFRGIALKSDIPTSDSRPLANGTMVSHTRAS
jgi:putative DNA primase/helicase